MGKISIACDKTQSLVKKYKSPVIKLNLYCKNINR